MEAGKPAPPPRPPGPSRQSVAFDPLDALAQVYGLNVTFTMGDFQDAYNRLRQPKKPKASKPRVIDARPRRNAAQQQGL